ncbi:helix-turn-helix domain-containing protein [Bacillus cereus]|uniref:HTH marR-type domain-containing protein n=1 Tax=Bacillus cereus HuA3-9 TaxID=1053205 RepID=R8CIS3_BACCE|nr:helix-turn-helix domain-containing protein [Bacillus cereus]EOO11405.1 hypothetical protein IGA_05668 [Bacillus cereus HuA3-9]
MTHIANNIIRTEELTANEKLVLLTLCVEGNGSSIEMAYEEIAHKCSLTRRSVIKFIKSLEEKGFLKVMRYYGRQNFNVYELNIAS